MLLNWLLIFFGWFRVKFLVRWLRRCVTMSVHSKHTVRIISYITGVYFRLWSPECAYTLSERFYPLRPVRKRFNLKLLSLSLSTFLWSKYPQRRFSNEDPPTKILGLDEHCLAWVSIAWPSWAELRKVGCSEMKFEKEWRTYKGRYPSDRSPKPLEQCVLRQLGLTCKSLLLNRIQGAPKRA